ncbi:hypothetical protein H6784_02685 [Candidatus Nomurabacteria bacterium]|nr:hypothetical protein [Candidatus Kaiserbacteria bacterium]MCB9814304.1 hypothetical protein [Candidatus Nomurabacteria bacterium]
MKALALKNEKALENYRVFPFIAWGLVIIFALFVYNIARELKEVTTSLQTQADYIQHKIDAKPGELVDFDN